MQSGRNALLQTRYPSTVKIIRISLQNMGFSRRDDFEAKPPVYVRKRPHKTNSQVLFHHCHLVSSPFGIAEFVVFQVEPSAIPSFESTFPLFVQVAFNAYHTLNVEHSSVSLF